MATKRAGMVKGKEKAPVQWTKIRTAEGYKRTMMRMKDSGKKKGK